jgi:hypothetical protein
VKRKTWCSSRYHHIIKLLIYESVVPQQTRLFIPPTVVDNWSDLLWRGFSSRAGQEKLKFNYPVGLKTTFLRATTADLNSLRRRELIYIWLVEPRPSTELDPFPRSIKESVPFQRDLPERKQDRIAIPRYSHPILHHGQSTSTTTRMD